MKKLAPPVGPPSLENHAITQRKGRIEELLRRIRAGQIKTGKQAGIFLALEYGLTARKIDEYMRLLLRADYIETTEEGELRIGKGAP